jgi:hypothetical protein
MSSLIPATMDGNSTAIHKHHSSHWNFINPKSPNQGDAAALRVARLQPTHMAKPPKRGT